MLLPLMLLIVLGGGGTVVTFVIALFFLPVRPAFLFAVLFVGAGLVGCVLGVAVQIPFLDGAGEFGSSWDVLRFLGIIGLAGVCSAALAAVGFIHVRRGRIAAARGREAARHFE